MYLVALSGGADSVCLLTCLHALGYTVEAVHCNFQLRGAESDRDERFCRALCTDLGIPLHLVHFDTKTYAEQHHVSIEMAARALRYSYFEQLRKDIGAAGVCVGHHRDDNVETILMNLVRSTGIYGLTGIKPRKGHVYRPLLCVGRKEIIDYLHATRQTYVTDSSNLVADVQRNKIRLEILPLLEQLNPAAPVNILKMAERLSDVIDMLDTYWHTKVQWQSVPQGYLRFPIAELTHEYLLWHLLKDYRFTAAQTEQIFAMRHAANGRMWYAKTHRLLIDRGYLLLSPIQPAARCELKIPAPGIYWYDGQQTINISIERYDGRLSDLKKQEGICADADKVEFPLLLRTAQTGDRFRPFGMKGSKLLSDFMTDQKCSVFEKQRQWVLTDARNRIVCVVDRRLDDRFRITDATSFVLKVRTAE